METTKDKSYNFSRASLTVDIEPDNKRVKQYDLFYKSYRNTAIIFLLICLLPAYFTYSLYISGHYIWGTLLGLLTCGLLFYTNAVYKSSKASVYNYGLLIPAIVVNESPLQILALANMEAVNPDGISWAVQKVEVKALPDQKAEIGTRVPCISLFGGSDGNTHRHFEPRPLCWATGKAADIENALAKLEEEDWILLKIMSSRTQDLEPGKTTKLDEQLNLIFPEE